MLETTALDRLLLTIAPKWALNRIRARAIATTLVRHYEAAQPGRRTGNWQRSYADPNVAAQGALAILRGHARDLVRNNSWAAKGLRANTRDTVGWGIVPKPVAVKDPGPIKALWKAWAGTTSCDADARLTFSGLEGLVFRTTMEAGECLVRRRRRRPEDGHLIPMQLQILEPDFIDSSKDGLMGQEGGPIIQGIEFDAIGRRVAYWLFEHHPGSNRVFPINPGGNFSKRVTAADIIHTFRLDRPGQVRGITWFAPAIVNIKDFDEFEDAELMRQKIAALFAGFITDPNGDGAPLGEQDANNPLIETMEPGMIQRLKTGQEITFANPPLTADGGFAVRTLRRVAAGLGVTYEDLTGDYSQVNFSSARMARIAHWGDVHDWRWNMLVPQFCDPAWAWAMDAAATAGLIEDKPGIPLPMAEWTPPPMPLLEPDKEGLAITRLVRAGVKTPSDAAREQGYDWDEFLEEYAKDQEELDARGIVLDSDVRQVSQTGQVQVSKPAGGDVAAAPAKPAAARAADACACTCPDCAAGDCSTCSCDGCDACEAGGCEDCPVMAADAAA